MDLVSYALTKKTAASAVSGVSGYAVDGQDLEINLKDGTSLTMSFPDPNGIKTMTIDSSNHLIVTLDDNSIIDCGEVPAGTSKAAIDIKKVSVLPTTDISASTIYLVPSSDGSGNDFYEEYIYADNVWERLGTQSSASEEIADSSADEADIDSIF